jgi:class 3 adenylate cyclase
MNDPQGDLAWLELNAGEPIPIRGTCGIGRASSNEVVLADDKVSRRHAIIHVQEQNELWLVDLGSRNGTCLNGRRIFLPIKLNDRDIIEISLFKLVFRQPAKTKRAEPAPLAGEETIPDLKPVRCWLLIADVVASTRMNQSLSAEELSMVLGGWLAESKQIVEECGGGIDKYLGDGFLACWYDRDMTTTNLERGLKAFKRLQEQQKPAFRVVLHYGQVFSGGLTSFGQESLFGKEIIFAFRMEKLAAALGEPRLLSEAASAHLAPTLPVTGVGQHGLSGFDGQYHFLKF